MERLTAGAMTALAVTESIHVSRTAMSAPTVCFMLVCLPVCLSASASVCLSHVAEPLASARVPLWMPPLLSPPAVPGRCGARAGPELARRAPGLPGPGELWPLDNFHNFHNLIWVWFQHALSSCFVWFLWSCVARSLTRERICPRGARGWFHSLCSNYGLP